MATELNEMWKCVEVRLCNSGGRYKFENLQFIGIILKKSVLE